MPFYRAFCALCSLELAGTSPLEEVDTYACFETPSQPISGSHCIIPRYRDEQLEITTLLAQVFEKRDLSVSPFPPRDKCLLSCVPGSLFRTLSQPSLDGDTSMSGGQLVLHLCPSLGVWAALGRIALLIVVAS